MVHQERCTGCRLCETVCALFHDGVVSPSLSRVSVIKDEIKGTDIPILCAHCDRPACREVCPSRAIRPTGAHGTGIIDPGRCIGCRLCVQACSFGGISLTPEGEPRKCDLCGGEPRCARYCPAGAIEYLPASRIGPRKRRLGAGRLVEFVAVAESKGV